MSQLHAGPIRAGPLQLRDRHVRGGRRDALRLEHRLVRLPGSSQVALSDIHNSEDEAQACLDETVARGGGVFPIR
jgi:hypothetical protein